MKKMILLLILLTLFSCERHTQEVIVPPVAQAQVVDLNAIDALNTAILQNDYHRVKETLEANNLNIDVINEQGKLVLNEAIKLDRLLIGELLIAHGANPDSVDENEESARILIDKSPYLDEWKLVLDGESVTSDYVTNESFTLVNEAAIDDQDEKVKFLGIFVDKGLDLNFINADNFTLLMIASSKNLVAMVDYLCSLNDIDPNLTITIVRRRKEYYFNARFYAKTPEMNAALDRCGAN